MLDVMLPLVPRLYVRSPVADVIPQLSLPAIVVSGGAAESAGPGALLMIWVALEDILRSKEAADRPQDRQDAIVLRALIKLKETEAGDS